MRNILVSFLAIILMPLAALAGDNATLWKKYYEAAKKDLPQSQIQILDQIIQTATPQKRYGDLMLAETERLQLSATLSRDSIAPSLLRLEGRQQKAQTADPSLAAVYSCVLAKAYGNLLSDETIPDARQKFSSYRLKSLAQPDVLAKSNALGYSPFVRKGADSQIFDNDLLSVIGYELQDFRTLNAYYDKAGNRPAALLTALEMIRQERKPASLNTERAKGNRYLMRLDSLIQQYGDLQECGEVALEKFDLLARCSDVSLSSQAEFIKTSLNRWQSWKNISRLQSDYDRMTQPGYKFKMMTATLPMRSDTIELVAKNLDSLTISFTRLKMQGNINSWPTSEAEWKTLKNKCIAKTCTTTTVTLSAPYPYEETTHRVALPKLQPGIYYVEFTPDNKKVASSRLLLAVSDMYVATMPLPYGQTRLLALNATTGKPVAGAKIEIWRNGNRTVMTTDAKGELIVNRNLSGSDCRALTATDDYMQLTSMWGSFTNYPNDRSLNFLKAFTDRAIYRPGQTVHASALAYCAEGIHKFATMKGEKLTFTLLDANFKKVASKEAVSDDYGTCAVDFNLPSVGRISGRFCIEVDGPVRARQWISVEEYKRPTFEITIDPVTQEYHNGDTVTLTGRAMTFAGVPVQGAKVEYNVKRRKVNLWRSYFGGYSLGGYNYSAGNFANYNGNGNGVDELLAESVVTDADGRFSMRVPVALPAQDSEFAEDGSQSDYNLWQPYFRFTAQAKITDHAGETHEAESSLTLGNRATSLSIDLPSQILKDSLTTLTVGRYNATGKKIEGKVTCRFDDGEPFCLEANGKWQIDWSKYPQMQSGRHQITAVCGTDTISQSFMLFSISDKRPAVYTDDWTYLSSATFPRDGSPVYLQVGTSLHDVNIMYSVFSDDEELEYGSCLVSDSIVTLPIKYQQKYGEGICINLLWVKNGKAHTHTYKIARQLEEKSLDIKWVTFRDKLTPGQKETWTLSISRPARPVDIFTPQQEWSGAQLLALMYDKSLDDIQKYNFDFSLTRMQELPSTRWHGTTYGSLRFFEDKPLQPFSASMDYNRFNFDMQYLHSAYIYGKAGGNEIFFGSKKLMAFGARTNEMYDMADGEREMKSVASEMVKESVAAPRVADTMVGESTTGADDVATTGNSIQMRENMQETAFFYPALYTDEKGNVNIQFTLPESVTTWKFYGFAHDRQMNYGMLSAEAVASKKVMVMPNVPRFVRVGDKATISTRIANTTSRRLTTTVQMSLENPETGKVIVTEKKQLTLNANSTESVTFGCQPDGSLPLLVCKISASGNDFSDGEQHYLPVLQNGERVVNTVPFTLSGSDSKEIRMSDIFPADATDRKLTVEYTANPSWLMIQALPYMSEVNDKNAISIVAAYYANCLGRHILQQNAAIKRVVALWKQETAQGKEGSLASMLEKNQELKSLLLDETPWVADADKDADQKRLLATFFDESALDYRLSTQLQALKKLQNSNGSWSWWEGMNGSASMTAEVVEILARLKQMTGNTDADRMIGDAMKYLGNVATKEYEQIIERERQHLSPLIWDSHALEYLYINALLNRKLPARERPLKNYLLDYLRRDRNRNIEAKAKMAVVLKSEQQQNEAREYVESIKQYTVSRPEMGRYFDTEKARYSWFDYRIPTQTAAIEALLAVTPDDHATIDEMRLWLLQSKRTQTWDTPINSVNAVYAFFDGNYSQLAASSDVMNRQPADKDSQQVSITIDGKALNENARASAGLGYSKLSTNISKQQSLRIMKPAATTATSWGAAYAQFSQSVANISDAASGLSVKRIVLANQKPLANGQQLKVGDRITVRLTITADRDYDFVQIVDKRAACTEPVEQTSICGWGYYRVNKDNATHYYFDQLAKGTHTVETHYYIDRQGEYTTGTCTVQCAYAPEFSGRTGGVSFTVGL